METGERDEGRKEGGVAPLRDADETVKHYRIEFKLQGYAIVPVSAKNNHQRRAYYTATRELNEALSQILRSGVRQISELHWETTVFDTFPVEV